MTSLIARSCASRHDDLSVVFAFILGLMLVTVSGVIGLFWSSCYFSLSSLQTSGSTRVYSC